MLVPRPVRSAVVVALVASVVVGLAPVPAAAATPVRDPSRFACPPGLTTPFVDVPGTTHADDIACAVHYELTGGTSSTTYGPGDAVTRGQMATFLVRLLDIDGSGLPAAPSAGFADTVGTLHERNIDAIAALGIAGGTGPGSFSPSAPVTRAQMATFLRNSIEVLGLTIPTSPPDAFGDDEGDVHEAAIDVIALLGLAGGTAPGLYAPSAPVTRGAMATFLVRTIDLGIEEGIVAPDVDVEGFAALGGPGGAGTAVVYTTDVPGVLCFEVVLEGVGTPTSARLWVGEGGVDSVAIPSPQGTGFTGFCTSDPLADDFATDVEVARLDVAGADGTLVEGVFGRRGAGGLAELEQIQVVPGPADPDAFGIAGVFTTTQPDVLCVSAAVVSQHPLTGVHVHQGPLHQNGPVVAEFGPVESFGVPISCRGTSAAAAFAADVDGFYVDVHSSAFPDGALRGQLVPAT